MNFMNSVFLAFAVVLPISVATADEAVWPKNSASEVATFATILRFQIYADHCSDKIPQLEARFDSLMESLSSRIQNMSMTLLATDEFNGMKNQLVPITIFDALKHSFHDVTHNVESLDAASMCSKTLQDFNDMDDEALQSALAANLKAVQNMSQKAENDLAR